MNTSWSEVLLIAILSALISVAVIFPVGYHMYKKAYNPIGVVDLQKLMQEHQERMLTHTKGGQSGESEQIRYFIERETASFAKKISDGVDVIGKSCGCILINKAALLTTVGNTTVDYTNQLRGMVYENPQ